MLVVLLKLLQAEVEALEENRAQRSLARVLSRRESVRSERKGVVRVGIALFLSSLPLLTPFPRPGKTSSLSAILSPIHPYGSVKVSLPLRRPP